MSFSNKPNAGHAMSGPITKQSADAWMSRNSTPADNITIGDICDTRSVEPGASMSATETKTPLAQLAGAAYIRASHDATTWFNVDAEAIRQAAQFYADMLEALEYISARIGLVLESDTAPKGATGEMLARWKEHADSAITKARGKE